MYMIRRVPRNSLRLFQHSNDCLSTIGLVVRLQPLRQETMALKVHGVSFASSTTQRRKGSRETDQKSSDSIALYERPSDTIKFTRAGLAMGYFTSCYWTWYAIDFVPTVNSSPIPDLHISPWVGVVACTIFYAGTACCAVYCTRMVSKVVLQTDSPDPIHIYRYRLPFMMPSSKPEQYPLGNALLDYNSDGAQKLLEKLEMNQTKQENNIQQFVSLNISGKPWPLGVYGLYVDSTEDIKDKDLFLESLLFSSLNTKDKKETRSGRNKKQHSTASTQKLPAKLRVRRNK